jgi:hypothetical protein
MATPLRGRHRASGIRYHPPVNVIYNTLWLLMVVGFLAHISVSARGLSTLAAGSWLAVTTLLVRCPTGGGGHHRAHRARTPDSGAGVAS